MTKSNSLLEIVVSIKIKKAILLHVPTQYYKYKITTTG